MNLKPLLCRARLFPDESILSYITRLAKENCYDPSDIYEILVGNSKYSPTRIAFPDRELLLRLSEISGETPEKLFFTTNYRFLNALDLGDCQEAVLSQDTKKIIKIRRSQLWYFNRVKYCPICIQENRYHRMSWIPNSLNICIDHGCLLMDRCPSCQKNVTIHELVDGFCRKCLYDFRLTKTVSIQSDKLGKNSQIEIHTWVCSNNAKSIFPSKHNPKLRTISKIILLEGLKKLIKVQESVWMLSPVISQEFYDEISKNPEYKFAFQRLLIYRTAFSCFCDWPHGLFAFLDSLRDITSINDLNKMIRNIRYWTKRNSLPAEESFWKRVTDYLLDRHMSIPGFIINLFFDSEWFIEKTGILTKKVAYRKLGITYRTEYRFPYQTLQDLQTGVSTGFNNALVEDFLQRREQGWTFYEAEIWWGINKNSMIELIRLGRLPMCVFKKNEWLISNQELSQFFNRIASKMVFGGSNLCLFGDQIEDKWSGFPLPKGITGKILYCIDRDLLPCFSSIHPPTKFDEMYIPKKFFQMIYEMLLYENRLLTSIEFKSIKRVFSLVYSTLNHSSPWDDKDHSQDIYWEKLWNRTMELLIKPEPIKDETLESYAYRIRKANFYDEGNWWGDFINLPRGTNLNYISKGDEDNFCYEVFRGCRHIFGTMTTHEYTRKILGIDTRDISNQNLILANSSRICPICHRETGVRLLPWLIKPITFCQKHKVLLIETCPKCGNKLYDHEVCTKCRTPIAKMSTQRLDQDVISMKYMKMIEKCIEVAPDMMIDEKVFPFSEMRASDFLMILIKLGTLLLEYDWDNPRITPSTRSKCISDGSRRRLRELQIDEYHQVMLSVFEALLEWPSNWHTTLERILVAESNRRNDANKKWKRRSFPYQLRITLSKIIGFEWMWNSAQEFIVDSKMQNIPGNRYWQRYKEMRIEYPKEMSFAISKKRFDDQAQRVDTCLLNFQQTIEYLGITRGNLYHFIENGLIAPVEREKINSRQKWVFSKKHLDEVFDYLFGHLLPMNFNKDRQIIKLVDIGKTVHVKMRWMDVLSAIYSEELSAYLIHGVEGIKSVWFYSESIEELIKNRRKSISIYTVMTMLSCGMQTLVHLANSGLLIPIKGYPGNNLKQWKYSPDSLNYFLEKYIETEEAARIVGVSKTTLTDWARKGWILPASGPIIDGAYRYRFDRNNIIQWRYERIISKEVREILGISERTMQDWIAKEKIKPIENMSQNPYWFDRSVVEKIQQEREEKKKSKNAL